ncbi:ADP-heptose--LPS heptosyltransferase 2 [Vibrio stylophorae]|uniref:lipopolysaccharide heptosyltransferase II n=1 Tax=Vibrio stylophorae TaxID=659351 RepID=A0ABN8DVN4_9VIBR|nr:lipopolysaccharide heptosyltransferase II [Vibrio stylophorae]CAH0534668.1 ADP-heptose--LPS heptosyltransferase 2 [Vibrio stylophorae]
MKILVIGPSWVGDMVMSQSLYRELKRLHPNAQIDVMAPGWCKPILARMPEVNQAIEMPLGHGAFDLKTRYQLGKSLRQQGYSQAYVLPNSAKSALIPWFANIPTRTGWKGEMRYGLLNDLRPNRKVFQYMVERYVALAHSKDTMLATVHLETCLTPLLTSTTEQQQQAMQAHQLSDERPTLGLCPGAEFGPAKRWPEQHYAAVARDAIEHGKQVWLFGSAKDRPVCDAIRNQLTPEQQTHCVNLAGQTSLIEAVDLIAHCEQVVSNDSGLMHVAAAVGCQLVGVYGSSSPKYTPPLAKEFAMVHTDIECRPCFKRECPYGHLKCLTELEPQRVIESLKKLAEKA